MKQNPWIANWVKACQSVADHHGVNEDLVNWVHEMVQENGPESLLDEEHMGWLAHVDLKCVRNHHDIPRPDRDTPTYETQPSDWMCPDCHQPQKKHADVAPHAKTSMEESLCTIRSY